MPGRNIVLEFSNSFAEINLVAIHVLNLKYNCMHFGTLIKTFSANGFRQFVASRIQIHIWKHYAILIRHAHIYSYVHGGECREQFL